jgi:hypothetical protein
MAVETRALRTRTNHALLTACHEAAFIDPGGRQLGARWPMELNDAGDLTNPADVPVPRGAVGARLFADDGSHMDIDLLGPDGRLIWA